MDINKGQRTVQLIMFLIYITIPCYVSLISGAQPEFKLNFDFRADLRNVELGPPNEEEVAAYGDEEYKDLGSDYGGNIGVGLAPGVRCIEEYPKGEDGLPYCKPVTEEDKKERKKADKNLVVLTTNGTSSDAHKRFLRSGRAFGYDVKVLDSGTGFVDAFTQLQLLRKAVAKYGKDDSRKLILFINGPDVILSSGPLRVVEELEFSEAGILIAADGVLRVNTELQDEFPKVSKGRRFLDSGAFVGKAEIIQALLKEFPEENDLQALMTKAYTKVALRKKHHLKIDHTSSLFQNLNGATADLELRFAGKEAYLQNTMFSTVPVVVKADGSTVPVLNSMANYLARAWREDDCRQCWEAMISLEKVSDDKLPMITFGIFIEKPTPFMEEFLETVRNISYPKNRLYLYVHNAIQFHKGLVDQWIETVKDEYKSVKYIPVEEKGAMEWHAKNQAIDYCLARECSHIFYLDSDGRIDNPYTLKLLIEQNRKVVAPLLPRPGKAWSNFWGALTSEGFYARSIDYMDIVENRKRGLWNVPFIATCMLVQINVFETPETRPSFVKNLLDADMAFCENLRDKGIFMYVSNRVDFGHMVHTENFNPMNKNPELWQMFENRWDWERRYLHPNYSQGLNASIPVLQPCPDVYWFPIFTERYAHEMIDLMESDGSWSDGSHQDNRLDGGYESVPTVDIHMNQVSYHDEWLEILRAYVQPLQLRVFEGYYNDVGPPRALMAFVVRYKPDEQPSLRPHHDTSTYTINVGLNRPGIDFQGGGCRFIRYNCSVVNTRVGWMLMHPGRLTHLHEGLYVTEGTRYIIVTFVDP